MVLFVYLWILVITANLLTTIQTTVPNRYLAHHNITSSSTHSSCRRRSRQELCLFSVGLILQYLLLLLLSLRLDDVENGGN